MEIESNWKEYTCTTIFSLVNFTSCFDNSWEKRSTKPSLFSTRGSVVPVCSLIVFVCYWFICTTSLVQHCLMSFIVYFITTSGDYFIILSELFAKPRLCLNALLPRRISLFIFNDQYSQQLIIFVFILFALIFFHFWININKR